MMRMMRLLQAAVVMIALPFAAHAACLSPVGQEGDQVYNITSQVMQFCNGSNWISMAGGGSGSGGGGGSDPRIGTINANQWCVGNAGGTGLDCTTAAPLTAEVDPKVGTLTNTKWCTTDGSVINCTTNAPLLAEDDPQTGDVTVAGKWCVTDGSIIQCTADAPVTAEVDPKVGTLTNTKWCSTDGSVINCTNNPPTSAGTLTANKWCTTDGTLINCTSNPPVTTEVDPEVGDITTAGKWCTTDGTMVNCNSDAPTGVSTLDDLTDVDATTGVAVGSIIAYDGSGWVVSDAAVGSANTASSTGAVQFNSGGQLAGDTDNFFWDDANDRLGIGTGAPSYALHVSGTGNVYGFIESTNNGATIRLKSPVGQYGWYVPGSTNQFRIWDYSASAVRMAVDSNGNVGIGTITPTATLQVSGTFTVSTSAQTTTPTIYTTTAGNVGVGTSSPVAKLDVSGNVSVTGMIDVGHTAQACATGISGSIRYETTSDTIQVCTGSGWKSLASTTVAAGAGTAASSTGAIQFNSGNSFAGDTTNLFWDDANKRLGIGTSSPLHVLNIAHNTPALVIQDNNTANSNVGVFGVVGFYDSAGTQYGWVGDVATSNYMTLYGGTNHGAKIYGGGIQALAVTTAGNVGIGNLDTPTAVLQVSGTFSVSSTLTNTEPSLYVSSTGLVGFGIMPARYSRVHIAAPSTTGSAARFTTSDFTVGGSGSELLIDFGAASGNTYSRLSAFSAGEGSWNNLVLQSGGGNVGIGMTAPVAKLDVSGNVSVTGMIDVGHTAQACATGISGSIRYETTSDTIQVCTGSGWKSLASTTVAAGAGTAASSTGAIQFNSGNSFAGDTTNLFWDDANDRLGIGKSSNLVYPLEISTTRPRAALNIGSATTGYGEFLITDEAPNAKWSIGAYGDSYTNASLQNAFYIFQYRDKADVSVSRNILFVNNDGLMAIGGSVTPTATLQVSGTFIVSATGQTTTPTVYVTNAGYFGIGTNAPSTQLDVAGSIEYTGTITDVSDRRMKHDIAALPAGELERMMLLKPVSFKMNGDAAERTEYGFIAQEVQEVYPILVNTSDDASKTLSLNYTGMIAPMVQAMQELKRENDALKARLDAIEKRLNAN